MISIGDGSLTGHMLSWLSRRDPRHMASHGRRRRTGGILWRIAGVSALMVVALGTVSPASEIDISANYLEYDEAAKYVVATDSVVITWGEKTLHASEVRFWLDRKYMEADGSVVYTEANTVLFADTLRYDHVADTAVITNASGFADPQYFTSDRIVRKSSTTFETGRIVLTTCDRANPHYVVRARRAKISLNKRITVYHPVFYLGHVPVFYLPLFSSALGSHRSTLDIQPGYSNQDGVTAKVIYGYPFMDTLYGKLYLDYYGKRGWGKGGELSYSTDTFRGTLYAYHIEEKTTGHERWTARSSFWQQLSSTWTTQAELDYVSDSSFNNSYYLENWKRVDQQVHSFVAATRQTRASNLRITAEEYDTYDPVTGGFVTTSRTLPRVSLVLYPKRDKMPFYTNFSAAVQNVYTQAAGYYTISGDMDLNVTRDFRLTRRLTYKPQVGISENWQNRTSLDDLTQLFRTAYYTNNNLRFRVLRWMDWDFSHAWRWYTKYNSLLVDTDAGDYGQATNKLSYANTMSFGTLRIKDTIGYDLRHMRGEVIDDWRQKLDPLVNEAMWTPRNTISMFGREQSSVYPIHDLQSASLDTRFGQPDLYFNFGAFYQKNDYTNLDYTTGIGFWPTEKWKIDYTLRWNSLNNFSEYHANDHEVKIYRDLHCWQVKLTYRRRQDAQEDIYLQLDLKSSSKDKKRYPTRDAQEFYPWR